MCSQRTRLADIGLRGGPTLRAVDGQEHRGNVVGIGRLGEIVDGAAPHRVHGRRNIAVAGQHDGARIGAAPREQRNDVEAVAVGEPHVDHRKGGRGRLHL